MSKQIKYEKKCHLNGTKAETLLMLLNEGYNVPNVYFFSVNEWNSNNSKIIDKIIKLFPGEKLAIRSSAKAEDTSESSMAGAFSSFLNVLTKKTNLIKAIGEVIKSFDDDLSNQVLVQPMVKNVLMSGVIMTQVLDDGSPYYVLNYDDETGLTDTVTSGSSINKTVYIYNGVDENDFDSPYLLEVLKLIRDLQKTFSNIPIDIEFAVDNKKIVHLLQVRKITTIKRWDNEVMSLVSERMIFLKKYVSQIMKPRPNLFGERTLLGFMPDWNPAEMIGVVPHPLALSLYRDLITNSSWRLARESMGYRKMPNTDLMVSLFGRVYIDVRSSINSFLPSNLDDIICEKLVNAYIDRLDKFPFLHDKIEFDVVHTIYDFDFDKKFNERYRDLLTKEELQAYREALKKITLKALDNSDNSSINLALKSIDYLKKIQDSNDKFGLKDSFSIADKINNLIGECIEFGTIPFSILARHGFIAECILRSAVSNNAISEDRILEFKKNIITISGEMSNDFFKVFNSDMTKKDYLKKYGHLRPSSYDILSPNYSNRDDIFSGKPRDKIIKSKNFKLTAKEQSSLNILLEEHGLDDIKPNDLMNYAEKAIKGREYGKFIFTKHLSIILELIAKWGKIENFSRKELSMLNVNDVLNILFSPLTKELKDYYQTKINKAKLNFDIASSFKLSYLIRSVRDIHIVPMQRSNPNFIGNQRIEAEIIELTPYIKSIPDLKGKIVCIEGADPGYDWIFTRDIAGLITKYGGANSHMAIRCAEYNIPASIGCGEQPYSRIVAANKCLLDCSGKRLEPIIFN